MQFWRVVIEEEEMDGDDCLKSILYSVKIRVQK